MQKGTINNNESPQNHHFKKKLLARWTPLRYRK